MKKTVNCSFDDLGVVITAWNGVHPDRPGHYSKTITMSRQDFNEACADRRKFGDALGIDVSAGWQNPIKDAINGAKGLKVDMNALTKFLVEMLAKYHGADAEKVFAELETQNGKIEEIVTKHCEEMESKMAEKIAENDTGAEEIKADLESQLKEKESENSDLNPESEVKNQEPKGEQDDGQRKGTGTRKGGKKSRGENNPGTPDESGDATVA